MVIVQIYLILVPVLDRLLSCESVILKTYSFPISGNRKFPISVGVSLNETTGIV